MTLSCSTWAREGPVRRKPSNPLWPHSHRTLSVPGAATGGRASSRPVEGYMFDHGAQFVAAGADDAFAAVLQRWVLDGVVQPWQGRFGLLRCAGDTAIFVASNDVAQEDHPGYVLAGCSPPGR
jgi:hypothetical protein